MSRFLAQRVKKLEPKQEKFEGLKRYLKAIDGLDRGRLPSDPPKITPEKQAAIDTAIAALNGGEITLLDNLGN